MRNQHLLPKLGENMQSYIPKTFKIGAYFHTQNGEKMSKIAKLCVSTDTKLAFAPKTR